MSTTTAPNEIVDRAMEDESFLSQLRESPEMALHSYDLSEEQKDAFLSGDEQQVQNLFGPTTAEEYTVTVVVIVS